MKRSKETDKIDAALVKAQAAMKPATKDAVNPHFKSKYADLASVFDALRKPLTDHGIAVIQDVENIGRAVAVSTRLVHAGQFYHFGPLVIPLAKEDAHGVGSAITYGKRYGLSAAVGLATEEDDDGNAAVRPSDRVDAQDRPVAEDADLPLCPKCRKTDKVIVSKYGPGFYCLRDKSKWDPVKEAILAEPGVEEAAAVFE